MDNAIISQQLLLKAIENAGSILWRYMLYMIGGSIILFTVKNYALNILTRVKLLLSQERCTRPGDEVIKKGKKYKIDYIEWLGGKIKFTNVEDSTDEILQETQDYWKKEIAIINNKRGSRRKDDK